MCVYSQPDSCFSNPIYLSTHIAQKIVELEKTIGVLRNQITAAERAADAKEHSLIQIIHVHENMHECELLYIHGCIYDAVKLLLEITSDMSEDLRNNMFLMKRFAGGFPHIFTIQTI